MDQKIKNFDRGIEQRMNEHEVAPPFGMWNRISAELDAMPVPVAAAAPVVTQLIPKRAIAGIIASVLILGATITTGYLVNASVNKKEVTNQAAVSQPVSTSANVVAPSPVTITAPTVKHEPTAAIPVVKEININHINNDAVQSTLPAAQQVNPNSTQPVATNTNSLIINNSNTDVPTPIEPVAQSADNQTYYFPPIDVTTPEKSQSHTPATISKGIAKAPTTDEDENSSKTSSGEHKFRFRNHKKGGWSWGKINTTK